ncbi:hybrid sensor histidine kinase/response regulator [Thioalkalivibrio thiocyanodenitrificans]|uniref:hybrid sensor histidine kinase/response regulator n=1 Tax=Thioalkalivibrio thiocyanodenitrificans TaxID=243063 RepID=UPI00036940BD|nr:PAS domain S-box protein [Thioalkalivibrio thiocyanodenitrificans]
MAVSDPHAGFRSLIEQGTPFQEILDNSTAVIFVKDREGRYLLVNRRFLQIVGRPASDVLGRLESEVVPEAMAADFRENDLRVLASGEPVEFEETYELPDGAHSFISLKFPMRDADGRVYAVCGMSTEITARKRIEEALRKVALDVSAAGSGDVLAEIACSLTETLGVDMALVGKRLPGEPVRIQALAACLEGEQVGPLEYPLEGTPCAHVVGRSFQYIPDDLQTRFPGDGLLGEFGLESYAGYPLFDSSGDPTGLVAVLHRGPLPDAAFTESILRIFSVRAGAELERIAAEEARRASESSYRAIIEASEDAIYVHDMDTGAIVDVNPKACEALGYSRGEMLRISVDQLSSGVPPYTGVEAARLMDRARQGEPMCFEWHRRNRDGSLHWDEVWLKRIHLGGVDRIVAITREITQRKEREVALRRSEDRLRATVEASLDCIIGMDVEGRITEFNPAAEQCFGLRRDDVMGQVLAELIIPQRFRAEHQAGLMRFRETGEGPYLGRRVEITAQRADGTEFPAELAIDVVRSAEGDLFIGYLRDITERRLAEEGRAQLEAQLRQAQKMEAIGHLTGGIAHDFNNILTGVMGYVVLAQERAACAGDDRLVQYLERASESALRARDLIQQMLTFSRGQRGDPRPLDPNPLVREAVKLLRSTLPATVSLNTQLADDVPPVRVDPVQVEQVLMNLCINARDAMQGHGAIRVRLRGRDAAQGVCASCREPVSGDFVELSVGDEGPGVAPAHLDRIFDPFYTTKGVGQGSGMGLATVHGIVHEHGGHVELITAPGRGAEFRVLLPALAPETRAGSVAMADAAPMAGRTPPRLRGRMLLADDDDTAGAFVEELLRGWGLTVARAHDGVEAREMLEAGEAFDAALLDRAMPGLSGLEVAAWARDHRPDLPVVLYTGYSEDLPRHTLEGAGIRALVHKPVDIHVLWRVLRDVLGDAQGGQ